MNFQKFMNVGILGLIQLLPIYNLIHFLLIQFFRLCNRTIKINSVFGYKNIM